MSRGVVYGVDEMSKRPKRNMDGVRLRITRALESMDSAIEELRKQNCPENAEELLRLRKAVALFVSEKGWLYFAEHGEDWK